MSSGAGNAYCAPAKVNLALLVGPPRDDGYHPLCTVLVPIDLGDEIFSTLTAVPPGEGLPPLRVECSAVSPGENLASRAVEAVGRETGFEIGGGLVIEKHIPLAAGLGGGSSDAACALLLAARAVREAGGPAMAMADLERIALSLGADVPFFLGSGPALATGVGEKLEPLTIPSMWICLVFADTRLSTAEVYRTFDGVGSGGSEGTFSARCTWMLRAWRALSSALGEEEVGSGAAPSRVAGLLTNDLEMAALHLVPTLAAHRAALESPRVLGTLLCGSGPTMLGLCSCREDAEEVAARLQDEGYAARACRTLESFEEVAMPTADRAVG